MPDITENSGANKALTNHGSTDVRPPHQAPCATSIAGRDAELMDTLCRLSPTFPVRLIANKDARFNFRLGTLRSV
jgi:hypothetical protein